MAAKDYYHFRERRAPGQVKFVIPDQLETLILGISIKFSCCSDHRDQRGVESYN